MGVFIVTAFVLLSFAVAESRSWTDSSGKYTIDAEFAGLDGNAVRLRNSTGQVISIPLDRLSKKDREYVQQQTDQQGGGKGPLKELTVDLGGGVKMEFVLISAGEFLMGDPKERNRYSPVWPAHKVRITKPFYLGKYEVTQEQWVGVMGDRPGSNPSYFEGAKNPVETFTWEECQTFLQRLDAKAAAPGEKFGLPTEAQWEYACRAGTTAAYSFGEDQSRLGDYAWWIGTAERTTHPVGQKKPNAWGLYDMHGNVWEWCADSYGSDYYSDSPADDPTGPGPAGHRVVRGGCWHSSPPLCSCAHREPERGTGEHDLGFRVARTIAP